MGEQASDVQIYAEDLIRRKRRPNEILSDRAGQPYEKIERGTDRDYSARLAIGPGGTNEEFWR
jgi:ATP-dependent protease ClpP protease subunit